MKKQFYLTQEGIDSRKQELQRLIGRRREIAEAIKTAREQGDLTENAEYHAAKDDQERTESRISEIETILQHASIISKPRGKKVQLGSCVKLKAGNKSKEFQVVGTVEADPLIGKISDESPIGRALLGKTVGEAVEIKTPVETTSFKVVEIY